MKTREEMATGLFNSGCNCSQAVLAAFCEKYGMGQETALKLSCGLGGGIRSGEVCGAVSGAALVIGLKYGQAQAEDKAAKNNCYAKTVEFINAFKEANNSIICREILGHDISEKEAYEKAQNKRLFTTICVDMVKSAAQILEESGY